MFQKQNFNQKNKLIIKFLVCKINMLAGHRIIFYGPHPNKNEKTLAGRMPRVTDP